jgi:TRAP-type mannitol/chloroaromatic compound transport system substrate-binding protein
MLQSYHQPAEVFEVLFNRKKFEALPADLQAIVRHAAEAASADMSWKAAYRHADDQAWLRERGVRFHKTPALVLRAQLRAWGAVAARHAQQNPFFDKVWRSQLEWARRTVGWSRETIVNPAAAHDYWFAGKSAKPGKSAKQPAY